MRMYGKRFLAANRTRAMETKRETRDGIIWSIDLANRQVGVRIQRSNTEIKAYFPENWYEPPPWCKLGNSIKIMHTGGYRGRIEIIGNGLVIPYPQTGSLWPSDPLQENMILSGLQVLAMPNIPGNKILVTVGTARIEGTIVEATAITMADGDEWLLGEGGLLGQIAAVLSASPAVSVGAFPDWGYRIHSVQIDQSANITLTAGDQFQAYNDGTIIMDGGGPPPEGSSLDNLPAPDVPWGSLEVGRVLRYENQTVIRDHDINVDLVNTLPWSRFGRLPTRLSVTVQLPVMEWTDSTSNIDILCLDNFEQYMYFENISLEASIINGNGKLRDRTNDTGYATSIIAKQVVDAVTGVWQPAWAIEYKRDQLSTDKSPTIKLTLLINNEIVSYVAIELLDSSGNPMY